MVLDASGYPDEDYHTFSYRRSTTTPACPRCAVRRESRITGRVIKRARVALSRQLAAETPGRAADDRVLAGREREPRRGARDLRSRSRTGRQDDTARNGLDDRSFVQPPPLRGANDRRRRDSAWPLAPCARQVSRSRSALVCVATGPVGPIAVIKKRARPSLLHAGQDASSGWFVSGITRTGDSTPRIASSSHCSPGPPPRGSPVLAPTSRSSIAPRARRARRAKTTFFSNAATIPDALNPYASVPSRALLADHDLPPSVARRGLPGPPQRAPFAEARQHMLEFSRIEAGRATGAVRPVRSCAADGNLAQCVPRCIENGLHVRVACPPLDRPCSSTATWEKLVLNFVSNAFFQVHARRRIESLSAPERTTRCRGA